MQDLKDGESTEMQGSGVKPYTLKTRVAFTHVVAPPGETNLLPSNAVPVSISSNCGAQMSKKHAPKMPLLENLIPMMQMKPKKLALRKITKKAHPFSLLIPGIILSILPPGG
jgi:hypothetical protein